MIGAVLLLQALFWYKKIKGTNSFMWNDFRQELHYKYIQLLLKDLSPHESRYLKVFRDNIDNFLIHTYEWYEVFYTDLHDLSDNDEWEDYFNGSELEKILITMLGRLDNHVRQPLGDFYRSGGRLAYSHMGKPYEFRDSDRKALNNLQDYVSTVSDSINSEFCLGIKKSIGEHIENRTLDQLKDDLFQLRFKPIESRISPETRCLFTTKTEYARAVNTGLLQGYSNYNVDLYDWVTSGLPNVCKKCLELEENNPYTLNEVINYACPHPNCVCSFKARLPKKLYLKENPRIIDLTPKKNK